MARQSNISTGEKLLSLINDIELITKEILENTIALKHQKLSGPEQQNLTALLVAKDNELKDTLKVASDQAKINQKMDLLRTEVEQQDQDIQQLQRHLKEAEQILATAIFQAKQKLQSINRANKNPVPSEELIKYAHRISASNAVCAPLSWAPGDPRRPYPTDIEMRLGFLGRLNDMPMNGHMMQQTANMPDMLRPADAPPASQQNQFQWHPSGEIHMAVGQGSVPMDTRNHNKDAEDVEVMSTDSSSSSSSDSQ
ncbi:mediator of RNA polymerase II transcription subunit 4-like [Macrosteles quadrilineatus]|uniref:mediator of RNA polymerase II transcription subunit 4-like n=1 Tax=Macrosteles quadrilineatus TaxID=74068 RepID=UPI0023E1DD19|nr:mediator of RNA polymerase II transcription subunit 4-like [Macrosteles quadrilineatus]XP_054269476.1 mediator of RNA polymerase II transcription subunit 4-like [Macrosteles quadrilineatus]